MSEHTPLPWKAGEGPHAGGIPIICRRPHITIAVVSGGRSYEEMQANARLIEHACNSHYDLLAALEALLLVAQAHSQDIFGEWSPGAYKTAEEYEASQPEFDAARAAIAQAKLPA